MARQHILSLVLTGCAVALAASTASAATVYKWTDEKGVVNYTTTPPDNRKTKTIDAAPAVAGREIALDYDEARYWRERGQRETLRELRDERQRNETESLRQAQLRQDTAARAAEASQRAAQKNALDLAIAQCKAERRVDCDALPGGQSGSLYGNPYGTLYGSTGYPVYPPVVVVQRRPAAPVTTPYFSTTSNFTPGFSKPLLYATPR